MEVDYSETIEKKLPEVQEMAKVRVRTSIMDLFGDQPKTLSVL